ncbi:hypothetical protein B0H13DRAFT_2339915 [Mycena leptocephala]|nr:hypothetical protein B0H13DRAFT_2339915 [Mycena leptocephala]
MQRHPLHRLAAVPPRVSRPPLRDANASATALAPAMRNADVVRRTVQNANALLPPALVRHFPAAWWPLQREHAVPPLVLSPPCANCPCPAATSSRRFLRDANAYASSRMPCEHPPAHMNANAPRPAADFPVPVAGDFNISLYSIFV